MQTAPLSGPTYETHFIRYGNRIIVKAAIPTKSTAELYANEMRAAWVKFSEKISHAAILEAIEDGAPMMLVNGLPFDKGLAQPLLVGYDEFPKATFVDNGTNTLQGLNSATPFSILNPRSVAFLKTYQYGLVTAIVEEQKAVIAAAILDSFTRGLGGYEAAKLFRGQIGLTTRQAGALRKFAERQSMLGVRPDVASRRVARYEARLHKYRADRIARTELNRAANAGEIEGYRQAADLGMIDRAKTKKHWLSYLDNRTSDYCESNDGQVAFLDEPFEEGFDYPPAHPHCRSTTWVEYVLKKPGATAETLPNVPTGGYRPAKMQPRSGAAEAWKEKPVAQRLLDDDRFRYAVDRKNGGDQFLREVWKEQGFAGKPQVVSKEAFEKMILDMPESHVLTRGHFSTDMARQMMYEEYYAGSGIYGNGTYTAYGRRAADVASGYTGYNDGVVTRMALNKNARIIDFQKATNLATAEGNVINARTLDMWQDFSNAMKDVPIGGTKPARAIAIEKEINTLNQMREVTSDPGRWASMMGYDAINVIEQNYMVVLNRTALTFAEM